MYTGLSYYDYDINAITWNIKPPKTKLQKCIYIIKIQKYAFVITKLLKKKKKK